MKIPSLRKAVPELEAEFMLPVWLLAAILSAAAAETITIGLSVWREYGVVTGWVVGGVISSAQAAGSQMLARALQHNGTRKIVHKTVRGERVVDRAQSEPALNWSAPLIISILAGVASGIVGFSLYNRGGATGFGVALSIAAPVGSISVALLNGLFAHGEMAVQVWREAHPAKRPAKPSSERPVEGRLPSSVLPVENVSRVYAAHLAAVQSRLSAPDIAIKTFRRQDVETWRGIGRTHAAGVIRYGLETGVLINTGGFVYKFVEEV